MTIWLAVFAVLLTVGGGWFAMHRWQHPKKGQARLTPWAGLVTVLAIVLPVLASPFVRAGAAAGPAWDPAVVPWLRPAWMSYWALLLVLIPCVAWAAAAIDRWSHDVTMAQAVARAHGAPLPPRSKPWQVRVIPWVAALIAAPVVVTSLITLLLQLADLQIAAVAAAAQTSGGPAPTSTPELQRAGQALAKTVMGLSLGSMGCVAVVGAVVVGLGALRRHHELAAYAVVHRSWSTAHPEARAAIETNKIEAEQLYHARTRPDGIAASGPMALSSSGHSKLYAGQEKGA